jgi:regulatory protein
VGLRRPRAGDPSVEVMLEAGERLVVHDRRLSEHGVTVGTGLDTSARAALQRASACDAAERRALRLIARRPRSHAELRRRLGEWGLEPDEAAALLERLAAIGMVDDGALAAAVVSGRRADAYGRLRVRHDLERLEIPPDVEAAVAATSAEAELERARRALGPRIAPDPGDPAAVRRAAAFLARRGFDAETVATVLRLDIDG